MRFPPGTSVLRICIPLLWGWWAPLLIFLDLFLLSGLLLLPSLYFYVEILHFSYSQYINHSLGLQILL